VSEGLGRIDKEFYSNLEADEKELRRLVTEFNAALEKFPRKNRHSQEWYERYNEKLIQLREKLTRQENTEVGIK
jgi:hypothetical protein